MDTPTASVTRDVVFGKLGAAAMRTLQGAHELARLRGDGYIEPLHWLAVWLRADDTDVSLALDRLGVERASLLADVARALEGQRRARSSRLDFGRDLELAIERGWVSASLVFGAERIRTGHLLHGMLERTELRRLLFDISGSLRALDAAALARRFGELTRGSAEEADALAAAPATAAVGGGPAIAGPGGGETALARFTTDLTGQARAGAIDPVHGRDREIREVVDILMRRRQNNPLIVGEAGVGKTALVEGLALRIAAGDVPPPLREARVLSLDVAALQAGASARGEFETRLKAVVAEAQDTAAGRTILFVDEAHTLMGAGGPAGTGDAANILKPALARGTLRTIGATTWSEYKRHIERDAALTRRFQAVQVGEPDEATAERMLRALVPTLERHHGVQLLDEALQAAVRLSARHIQGRQLPDKAVSVLDTACARVAVSQAAVPPGLEDARRGVADLEAELAALAREARIGRGGAEREVGLAARLAERRDEVARLEGRFEAEVALARRVVELRAGLRAGGAAGDALGELEALQRELADLQGEAPLVLPAVDGQAVASVVEGWTGVPVRRMVADEIEAVLGLEGALRRRVVGQDHALRQIARRVETARAGLDDPNKPKGVFLLVGPSGVGKTETALALAERLFGSEDRVIAINMSEFQESHSVSTLKGAPPGYVGYGEGGRLTEAVRRRPYSVVLLDEVEKAHPDVHELFFQVFDKGAMEDGEGRRIDFRNTLILLTSNVGSDVVARHVAGGHVPRPEPEALARALRGTLLGTFPAALLGRLTLVPYYPLGEAALDSVIRLQLGRVARRVAEGRGVPFSYDDAVVGLIRGRCTEQESGGRMVDAVLSGTLLPAVSREILERLRSGRPLARVHVGVSDDGGLAYAFE